MRILKKIYKAAFSLALVVGASHSFAAQSSFLSSGQTLVAGQSIVSAFGGQCRLLMQSDGNLVLSNSADPTSFVWSSGTSGNRGATATLQNDGNFVVHSAAGKLLWASRSGGHPQETYSLQLDALCGLSIADYYGVIEWNGRTNLSTTPPFGLYAGDSLGAGQFAESPDHSVKLLMQTDGNLVLSKVSNNAVITSSGTSGNPGAAAVLQPDGNLVVYSAAGKVLWSTDTGGRAYGTYLLQVQSAAPYLSITSLVGSVSIIWQLQ